MAFCTNCGQRLAEGAHFCGNCGKVVGSDGATSQRKTVYDGELHKCPNCGELLDSFVVRCPSCGYELRASDAPRTINDFFKKIEETSTDELRVLLIRNYPIPNTKEDIFEFMILASSNISGDNSFSLSEAWKSKFEQGYQKAKLLFCDEPEFEKIQTLYEKTQKRILSAQLTYTTKQTGRSVSRFLSAMPNPVFGVVTVLVICFEIIQFITGRFAGIDIIFCAVILGITYKITEGSGGKKHSKSTANTNTITDTAHTKIKKIKIPSAIINGTCENYLVAEKILIKAGFVDVTTVPLNDLTTGFFNRTIYNPGSIDTITINGENIYSYYRRKFECDVPIVITYHSMR